MYSKAAPLSLINVCRFVIMPYTSILHTFGFSDTIQRLDVLVYQIVVAGTDAPMGDD